jgi:hypothetical protein
VQDALEQLTRHPADDAVDRLVDNVRSLAVAACVARADASRIAGTVRAYPEAAGAIAAASTMEDMIRAASVIGKDAWTPHQREPRARSMDAAARRCDPRATCAARGKLQEALQSEAWRTNPEAFLQLAAAAGADARVQAVIRRAPSAARCLLQDGAGELAAWQCGRLAGRRHPGCAAAGGDDERRRSRARLWCARRRGRRAVVQDTHDQWKGGHLGEAVNRLVNAVHQLAMAAGMQGTDAKRIEDLVRACPHAAEAIAAASTTEGMMAAAQTSGEDAWAPRRGARGRDRARAVGVTVR